MAAKPTQSREGVKGQLPLAESRGCSSSSQLKRKIQAEQPWSQAAKRPCAVTLRVRRRAPQTALSTYSTLSRQMGATDQHREKSFSLAAGLFCCRDFASAEATRGLCDRPLDCFAPLLSLFSATETAFSLCAMRSGKQASSYGNASVFCFKIHCRKKVTVFPSFVDNWFVIW